MTTQKTIEVELRGPLTSEECQRLKQVCETHGEFLGHDDRLLLDLSVNPGSASDDHLDVRVRTTNGQAQLVGKFGAFGAAQREEVTIDLANGQFENAVSFMNMLGFKQAVVCDRGIDRYQVGAIEIAIQEARYFPKKGEHASDVHSMFFEAEIVTTESEKDQAEQQVRDWLAQHGFKLFEDNAWYDYIEVLNRDVNGTFDANVAEPSVFNFAKAS